MLEQNVVEARSSSTARAVGLVLAGSVLAAACSGSGEGPSPAPRESNEPALSALSALSSPAAGANTGESSRAAFCTRVQAIMLGFATTYLQQAFFGCTIDNYFNDEVNKDGLLSFRDQELIPFLFGFFGCPQPGGNEDEPWMEKRDFDFIPESNPPFTVSSADASEIVNTFMAAATFHGGVFGFTQGELERLRERVGCMAHDAINSSAGGLTHSDPGCSPTPPLDAARCSQDDAHSHP